MQSSLIVSLTGVTASGLLCAASRQELAGQHVAGSLKIFLSIALALQPRETRRGDASYPHTVAKIKSVVGLIRPTKRKKYMHMAVFVELLAINSD
ncbi:hypothetical protein NQ318_009999 [Aromia moschata]|uniref:Secreted protein n=1 Tax=Aromia moschata TaxID=1265417 RepID=A0AAV8YBU1_9CUCU|nr:hypothetical protein NQ318_009999 [Aromia moschata]